MLLYSKVIFEKLETSLGYYTRDMIFLPYPSWANFTENILRDIK